MKVFVVLRNLSQQLDGWSWSADTSVFGVYISQEAAEAARPDDENDGEDGGLGYTIEEQEVLG